MRKNNNKFWFGEGNIVNGTCSPETVSLQWPNCLGIKVYIHIVQYCVYIIWKLYNKNLCVHKIFVATRSRTNVHYSNQTKLKNVAVLSGLSVLGNILDFIRDFIYCENIKSPESSSDIKCRTSRAIEHILSSQKIICSIVLYSLRFRLTCIEFENGTKSVRHILCDFQDWKLWRRRTDRWKCAYVTNY